MYVVTIDGEDFSKNVQRNDESILQNDYIQQFRNLNANLITRRLLITDKVDQPLNLVALTDAQYAFIKARNGGPYITASITGWEGNNFSGEYSLIINDKIVNKQHPNLKDVSITLVKT